VNEACGIAAENSSLKAFKGMMCCEELPTVTCKSKEYAWLLMLSPKITFLAHNSCWMQ